MWRGHKHQVYRHHLPYCGHPVTIYHHPGATHHQCTMTGHLHPVLSPEALTAWKAGHHDPRRPTGRSRMLIK